MQQIFQGIEHLREALNNSKKVLLVCDSSFRFLSIKEQVESIHIPYVQFSQFSSNPLYEDVCRGVDIFNAEKCDTILAVGGGSSLDVGKCIKLFCKMPKDSLYLKQQFNDSGVKMIAIPTTAGTGSESTRFAVIYYGGEKQSITHDSIIPDVAILEPRVLKTLPSYQKKCTLLDALCQGIESWWSVNSTDISKNYSKVAVETIINNWQAYIFENDDEAAKVVMQAANLAGHAICITQTTAPHAFSYKLTSLFGLPHGHAVAICLPEIWDYMLNHYELCIDKRGHSYLNNVFHDIALAMGQENPIDAIQFFRYMLNELEINNPHAEDLEKNINTLSYSVNPIRLRNNPVELNQKSIMDIYRNIVKK